MASVTSATMRYNQAIVSPDDSYSYLLAAAQINRHMWTPTREVREREAATMMMMAMALLPRHVTRVLELSSLFALWTFGLACGVRLSWHTAPGSWSSCGMTSTGTGEVGASGIVRGSVGSLAELARGRPRLGWVGLVGAAQFLVIRIAPSLHQQQQHLNDYEDDMAGVFIVGAKRTAFGAFGGKLLKHSATQLGVVAAVAALRHAEVDPKLGTRNSLTHTYSSLSLAHSCIYSTSAVDSVVFGNVAQTSIDAPYLARHVGLKAGVPLDKPALTVNRLCGSGFQSVINAVHEVRERRSPSP